MDFGTALFPTACDPPLDHQVTFASRLTGRLPHDLEHLAGDITLLVLSK